MYQSNIIKRLIAPTNTLENHDFKKFRFRSSARAAGRSLDHETLTAVYNSGTHEAQPGANAPGKRFRRSGSPRPRPNTQRAARVFLYTLSPVV